MNIKLVKRYTVLVILFFLPVAFLLLLLPAKHNYTALDVVKNNVKEINAISTHELEDHITIMAFMGKKPLERATEAFHLKELIYNKFRGFKRFQVVVFLLPEAETDLIELKQKINWLEDLKYWHFVFLDDDETKQLYASLKSYGPLDENLSSSNVFIVDTDRNQRGRLDARTEREVELNAQTYDLTSYDCTKISVIKNQMSEDMRVLFAEYRDKRKGNFKSSTRRANQLKGITDEQEEN